MKKPLLAILATLTITPLSAQTLVMPNTGGGEITLTNRVCKINGRTYENLKLAYSWTREIYFEGCWALIDSNIHVQWVFDNARSERRVYPVDRFSLKESM